MVWWIVGAVVLAYVSRMLWRAYTHPSHTLGRQAANLNWVAVGRVADGAGLMNLRVAREGLEAEISFRHGNVLLVAPYDAGPFADFVQLERWLAANPSFSAPSPEEQFYEAINVYVRERGYYDEVLEAQGMDRNFCIASLKMQRAAYLARQSEKVVGALTIEAAHRHSKNRDGAIVFLESVESGFISKARQAGVS